MTTKTKLSDKAFDHIMATESAARAMLAPLKAAAEEHGPLGDDTRPAWWSAACAAIAQAEAAGIKSEG